MSFTTASAILRGNWLIDKAWAEKHLALVLRMVKGESVDFGTAGQNQTTEKLPYKSANAYNIFPHSKLDNIPSGSIAVVNFTGPVLKYGDECSYGSVDHAALIARIANSENFSGILLNIDSPGGQADGTALLADVIKDAADVKPVIALVDDGMAASAAMWIASAASEIYTTKKTDQVGSVGVYTTIADWYGYFEKEGLKVHDVYAPQSTEKNKPYKEAIAGNDSLLKDDLQVLASEFINTIRTNRSGKLAEDSWTTGKLFYAKDAQRVGLIDGIMPVRKVLDRMNELIANNKQPTTDNSQIDNNMTFQTTLKAAKSEKFEVVEGGFLLTEEQILLIEGALTAKDAHIEHLNTEIRKEKDIASSVQSKLDAKCEEVKTLKGRVTELEESAPEFHETSREEDPQTGKKQNEFETSFDREAREMKAILP